MHANRVDDEIVCIYAKIHRKNWPSSSSSIIIIIIKIILRDEMKMEKNKNLYPIYRFSK